MSDPLAQQLDLPRGDTAALTFTATIIGTAAAAYQDFWFTIKRSSNDADPGLAQITPTLTNPAASTAAILSVIIPSSDLSQAAGLPDWDYLVYWDCKGKDASGYDFTLAGGTLLVAGSKNMTRAG